MAKRPSGVFMSMNDWVMDLTASDKETKEAFLIKNADMNVLMDLTCFDPQEFYQRFPQLKAVCSTLLSHNKRCEAHAKPGFENGLQLLREAGLTPVSTTLLSTGFVVARTMAVIINEAFYAWEEKTATRDDIDRAMRFGVNYPLGPFAWAKGRELVVVRLLETLLAETSDDRYRPAATLKNFICS
jgi:3-hydroxybutyryl-CoA dehydrogenase